MPLPPQDEDDAALARRISACADGTAPRDAAAEAELARRLAPRVRLYGLKHLKNPAAAADLAQDVVMLVITKLRSGALRDANQVASFALGTARQRVLDLRRGERRRERLLEAYAEDLIPANDAPAPSVDAQRLAGCLAALPERERTVIVMTFYDDAAAEAVGRELNLSAGNVRVIRHRGLKQLRACLEAKEGSA